VVQYVQYFLYVKNNMVENAPLGPVYDIESDDYWRRTEERRTLSDIPRDPRSEMPQSISTFCGPASDIVMRGIPARSRGEVVQVDTTLLEVARRAQQLPAAALSAAEIMVRMAQGPRGVPPGSCYK